MKVQMGLVFASVGLLMFASVAFARGGEGAASGPILEKATFAGGCFWCMEPAFDKLRWRQIGRLRLHRRPQGKPDLRGGLGRHDGTCRIDRDHLRSLRRELLQAARDLLAQYRSHGEGPAVLRCGLPVPLGDLLSRRGAEASCRGVEKGARAVQAISRPDLHRDCPPRRHFTPLRSITRNTTRRIRSDTNTTGTAAAAISV